MKEENKMIVSQSTPLVSIIMSVYNGQNYLRESVESILNQTYKNFEFIITDDGSKDNSLNILKEYSKKDLRIKLIVNDGNKGLIYSLNNMLNLSTGKYIARMDADDISLKNRLEEQVKFLEKNKNISMLGSFYQAFKDDFTFIRKNIKTINVSEEVKASLLFRNYICHPTVMIRKKVIEKYNLKYDFEDKGMEDYGLWLNLSKNEKIFILPKILLRYRYLSNSISADVLKKEKSYQNTLKNIFKRELYEIFNDFSDEDLEKHIEICLANNLSNFKYSIQEKIEYLERLKKNNFIEENYNQNYLNEQINERILEIYLNQSSFFKSFLKSREYKIKLRKFIFFKLKRLVKKFVR